jgi:hypothetical protein
MVEIITQYRTEDGELFETRDAAEAHERTIEPKRLASTLGDNVGDDFLAAILTPTEDGNRRLADALERAGYLVAQNRREAGVFKRAPKRDDEPASAPSNEVRQDIGSRDDSDGDED